MRLSAPRIEPVNMDRLDPAQREALGPFASPDNKVGGGRVLNIFRTLAHAPKALAAFLGWGNYVLSRRNALPERERELVILRTGWNCKSGYEWIQHRRIGLDCGLTADEIERVKQGPYAPGWTPFESALLRAADELVDNHFVSDATWAALAELGEDQFDIVVPSISVLAEPPVALVDGNLPDDPTRALATAYLEQLYSPEAQAMALRHYYRAWDVSAADPADVARFPDLVRLTIEDFGGWAEVQPLHFGDGGIFDQIYQGQ